MEKVALNKFDLCVSVGEFNFKHDFVGTVNMTLFGN